MKKTLLFLSLMMLVLSNTMKADLTIDNFDSKAIGFAYQMKAWYTTDGTATVAADPANSANKAVNIVTTNWDAMLKLTVTLPAGKKLSDYTAFAFDIYFGTNANDQNANYKNMFIFLDDVKKLEDTGYPKQAEPSTWTTKTFTLSSLNLTAVEGAKNTFTIAFGVSTDKGNYFIDNVKLTGGGDEPPPPTSGSFIISDFSQNTIGQALTMKAWYTTDGTATVAADPTNASNKVANVVTTNWDAMLKLTVTLPAGKKLADYESFAFDMYFPTNANDQNANYKNMFIYIDDVKKLEDTAYPKQAEMLTWTTKTFLLSSLALTAAEGAKTTFTIAFGISTDKGNYFIDNVKLNGGGVVPPPSGIFTIDFNDKAINEVLAMKAWYTTDGTATVKADPTNANNKAVNVVTTNWDAFLKLNITLPTGTTLTNYESLLFDIYIGTNANDQNPNYKNMFIYLDDVKKFEDTAYPKQAEVSTWTTKTFSLATLALTPAELAKNTFALAFGLSTDKGNYFLDNVKLIQKVGPLSVENQTKKNVAMFITDNTLRLNDTTAEKIFIYDLKGSLQIADYNTSSVDVSMLPSGIYIATVQVNGIRYINKVIK